MRVTSRPRRPAVLLLALAVMAGTATVLPTMSSATSGTVAGLVFEDLDVDGVFDAGEPGVAGAEVRAFDTTGAEVAAATTDVTGAYSLTITTTASTEVRVEFIPPTGYQSSFAVSGGSTVQFVSVGSTGVDLAIHRPDHYCQANPQVVCTLVDETVGTFASVRSFNWDNTGADTNIATNTETGAVWGLAWHQQTGTLFSAPTIRRNTWIYESPAGTVRPGQLFISGREPGSTQPYVDVEELGVDVGTVPNWATRTTLVGGVRDGFSPNGTWDLTGKAGIGDIDVSPDGEVLWFVNLHDRKLYRLDIGTPIRPADSLTADDVAGFAMPDPGCVNGVHRPWAIAVHDDGTVFVGGVCTAESAGATRANLEAVVYRFDPSSETFGANPVLRFRLDYTKGNAHAGAGTNTQFGNLNNRWYMWWEVPNGGSLWWSDRGAMPILGDIEFSPDGSMTLGFIDRMAQRAQSAQQPGQALPGKPSTTNWFWTAGGDILRSCTADQLTWQVEPLKPTFSTRKCTIGGVDYFTSITHIGQQSGEWEFFNDTMVPYSNDQYFGESGHLEGALGGLAAHRGSAEVVGSVFDPNSKYNTGGVRWFSHATGRKRTPTSHTGGDRQLTDAGTGQSFGKAGGIGDVEVLCDAAPLQIGDRVWRDLDGDGVQDPDEPGIAGVTARLYDTDGVLVSTAVTDANGYYRFSSTISKDPAGDGGPDGGNLEPFTAYEIRFDKPADYVVDTGPIGRLQPTEVDTVTSTATDIDDAIDSDATLPPSGTYGTDRFPVITVPPLKPGHNDHSFDIGFADPQVRLGDLVWHDLDRDGTPDPGEPSIAGATVTVTNADGSPVYDIDGNLVTSTVTDADGRYSFEGLPAGTYTVTVTPPIDFTASTPVTYTTGPLVEGEEDLTLDFGFHTPTVSIGDLVWFDTDRDGVHDPDEPGMPGVSVLVENADGTPAVDVTGAPVGTVTTDADGRYSVDLLPPGTYRVTVTTPSGYEATTDTIIDSDVMPSDGDTDPTLDAGLWAPSVSVGDRVWFDTNADGVQDPGEPGIGGVTLTITNADGSPVTDVFGKPVTSTVTDADGVYRFEDLLLGEYIVSITLPAGVDPTEPNATAGKATSTVMTTDGEQDLSLDFGVVAPMVSVGDRVWIDTDGDGTQDPDEPGLPGVTLTLTGSDGSPVVDVFGNPVTTAVTDENGDYLFENLPVGTYTVTITPPDGWTPSGTNAIAGSDTSVALTVNGAEDLTLDFGYVPTVSVGDRVWLDRDQDGVQDPDEVGIPGVTVTITRADGSAVTDVSGNPVTTAVTGPDGAYLFEDLPVGQYTVNVATPTGLTATTPTTITSAQLTTNGAEDLTLDAGFYAPSVSVGDRVWFDTDQDGVQDPDEPGIAGVTLTITAVGGGSVTDIFGNAVTTVVTDADGNYSFDALPLGQYTVTVTPPAGYTPTEANATAGSDTSTTLSLDGERDPTLDFGYWVASVSVGDRVWLDRDEDGVQDPGEPGIAGITLTITTVGGGAVTDVFGNSVTTVVTDADGNYSFDDLPLGQYTVSVTAPETLTATEANATAGSVDSVMLTLDGERDATLDFGYWVPPATVGGRVWSDLDGDGVDDPSEPGIAGVVMAITHSDGTPVTDIHGNAVTTVTTDADGRYVFDDLPFDATYRVTVADPAGHIPTQPGSGSDVNVDSATGSDASRRLHVLDTSDLSLGFGFVPKVTVGDRVFFDTDGDGVSDAGEPGIAGVTVTISRVDGQPVVDVHGNPVTVSVVTDADGRFVFPDLMPAEYTVTVIGPKGLDSTSPVTLTTSDTDRGADDRAPVFGFRVDPVSVAGLVWRDADDDGRPDPERPGVAGVTVTLTRDDGSPVVDVFGRPVTSTTTDADGRYRFDDLPPGRYSVTITVPDGWSAVTSTVVASVDLTAGQTDLDLDAGLTRDAASTDDADLGSSSLGGTATPDWCPQAGCTPAGESRVPGMTPMLPTTGITVGAPVTLALLALGLGLLAVIGGRSPDTQRGARRSES